MTNEAYLASPEYQQTLQDVVDGSVDLGCGVFINYTSYRGVRAGFTEVHRKPDGNWCGGSVTFALPETSDLPAPKWTVNSLDPLDISPSVLCRSCGHHGFIRQGKWVPA